jgi:23S rRNA pseudouridine1911/1915/1917 synthase
MNVLPFEILFEDAHILVCLKPSGIATQGRNVARQDMVSYLKNYIGKTGSDSGGGKEPYLAVVHRLDQPVRGIMVFAKTPFAAGELSRELAEAGFEKHYRALVTGTPPERTGIVDNYLVKDARANVSRICQKGTAGAKHARLSYQIVEEEPYLFGGTVPDSCAGECTEVDIRLYTGRHHQIRVQMAGIGCPIAGDAKYNPKAQHSERRQDLKLCSCSLTFTHPKTKETMRFSLL